jgi:hypothetical protein
MLRPTVARRSVSRVSRGSVHGPVVRLVIRPSVMRAPSTVPLPSGSVFGYVPRSSCRRDAGSRPSDGRAYDWPARGSGRPSCSTGAASRPSDTRSGSRGAGGRSSPRAWSPSCGASRSIGPTGAVRDGSADSASLDPDPAAVRRGRRSGSQGSPRAALFSDDDDAGPGQTSPRSRIWRCRRCDPGDPCSTAPRRTSAAARPSASDRSAAPRGRESAPGHPAHHPVHGSGDSVQDAVLRMEARDDR